MQKWEYMRLGRYYYSDSNLRNKGLQKEIKAMVEEKGWMEKQLYGIKEGWHWGDYIEDFGKEAENKKMNKKELAIFLNDIKVRNLGADARINELGAAGWELISVVPLISSHGTPSLGVYTDVESVQYYFKRPLED